MKDKLEPMRIQMHDDGFDPRPNGELQEVMNYIERDGEFDPDEFDDYDLWDGRVDWSREEDE